MQQRQLEQRAIYYTAMAHAGPDAATVQWSGEALHSIDAVMTQSAPWAWMDTGLATYKGYHTTTDRSANTTQKGHRLLIEKQRISMGRGGGAAKRVLPRANGVVSKDLSGGSSYDYDCVHSKPAGPAGHEFSILQVHVLCAMCHVLRAPGSGACYSSRWGSGSLDHCRPPVSLHRPRARVSTSHEPHSRSASSLAAGLGVCLLLGAACCCWLLPQAPVSVSAFAFVFFPPLPLLPSLCQAPLSPPASRTKGKGKGKGGGGGGKGKGGGGRRHKHSHSQHLEGGAPRASVLCITPHHH